MELRCELADSDPDPRTGTGSWPVYVGLVAGKCDAAPDAVSIQTSVDGSLYRPHFPACPMLRRPCRDPRGDDGITLPGLCM